MQKHGATCGQPVHWRQMSIASLTCFTLVGVLGSIEDAVQDPAIVFETVSLSVCTVTTARGTGTAFVDDQGRIVTAAHVVEDIVSLEIRDSKGNRLTPLRLIALDQAKDVAIISIKENLPRLPAASSATTKVGSRVYVIGSPLGLELSITEGIISAKRKIADVGHLQISAAISPGSSGSPVVNSKGQLLGMVVTRLEAGDSLGFALSTDEIGSVTGVDLQVLFSKPIIVQKVNVATRNPLRELLRRTFVLLPIDDTIYHENLQDAGIPPAPIYTLVRSSISSMFESEGYGIFETYEEYREHYGIEDNPPRYLTDHALSQTLFASLSFSDHSAGLVLKEAGYSELQFSINIFGNVFEADGTRAPLVDVEVTVLTREWSYQQDVALALATALEAVGTQLQRLKSGSTGNRAVGT